MTVRVPFQQALRDITGGNQRLLTTDYKGEGAIPVIDQGQAMIAGFTDDLTAVCRRDGPVILFGDHTRALKFVDFDFALGADGVKVLKALPGFDARFLFHFLRTVRLPENLGYSRHFKFLKECSVPKPAPDMQQRIAAILDKADSLRRKRQEAIRLSDEFLRSAYLDLAKKHPDRASVESVLANIPNAARTGPFGSQMLVSEFTEIGIPVLGIDNVVSNTFTWGARRFVSPEKYLELERYTVRPGDVLVTIMGTTGRVAVAPDDLPLCISTKHLCTLSLDQQKMRPFYLWAGLRWDPEVRAQTQRESKGAIMEGWNMGIVKGLMVSKPPLDAQLKFETLTARIGRFSKSAGHAADETDKFIASLSAKYLGSPVSV